MASRDDDTNPASPEAAPSAAPGAPGPVSAEGGAAVDAGYADASPEGLVATLKAVWYNPAYRFVLLFLPYLVVVSFGYPWVVKENYGIIQAFIEGTAAIEYWLFEVISDEVTRNGKMIVFGGFAVKIIDECTGIYEMLIFSAAVLAFPTSWRNKAIGLLMGCPLIYLFNVLRIAMLIAVGRYYPRAFEFMHLYFWQATMIVMITSVWLLWIVKVVRREEDAPPAAG